MDCILDHIMLMLNFSSDNCMVVKEENDLDLRGHMLKHAGITELYI